MTLTVKDTQLETDENGFLRDPAAWNEDVMQALVAQHEAEGHKPLSETAKGLVGYMREHYEETETVPGMHKIIEELGRAHGESFAEGEDYKAFLYEMFPHGPVQMLAKLAGLDPLEFRILNAYRDGDMKAHGKATDGAALVEVIQAAAELAGWPLSDKARAASSMKREGV